MRGSSLTGARTRQHSAIRDDKTHDPDPAGPATTGVANKLAPHGPRPTAPLEVREMKRVVSSGAGDRASSGPRAAGRKGRSSFAGGG
jgi:hypothetical protein